MADPKKYLGQHWLSDDKTLQDIVDQAELTVGDTVLEIGPGTGYLTRKLLGTGARVIAVEKDQTLATQLRKKISGQKFYLHTSDIRQFDLSKLASDYKVVANIPYYLTSHLLRLLSESSNPPARMVLLLQKEVAERICAKPGQMSLLAVSTQLYYNCRLGELVPAKLFQPVPKVDSQVVVLNRRPPKNIGLQPMQREDFFRVVKAGFSSKRKKLRSSLAGGLGISKEQAEVILMAAGVDPHQRAQSLSLADWQKLSRQI